MNTRNMTENPVSRRSFLGGAATFAACAMMPRGILGANGDKPNSVFNGVRIGCITYSYRGEINSAEDTLKALIEDGLSEVEMMDGPIRSYTGITAGVGRRPGQQSPAPTDEQRQAQLAKCVEMRKMYNDAGVNIHIHKTPFGASDEAIDFNFQVAGASAASASLLERSEPMAKRPRPSPTSTRSGSPSHNHTDNYPRHARQGRSDPGVQPRTSASISTSATTSRAPRACPLLPMLEKYCRPHRQPAHEGQGPPDGGNVPGKGGTPPGQGDPATHEEGKVDVSGGNDIGRSEYKILEELDRRG